MQWWLEGRGPTFPCLLLLGRFLPRLLAQEASTGPSAGQRHRLTVSVHCPIANHGKNEGSHRWCSRGLGHPLRSPVDDGQASQKLNSIGQVTNMGGQVGMWAVSF